MCYQKKLSGIKKGIFLFSFLLYQSFVFAQSLNNIKGDRLICLHFSYTYYYKNLENAKLLWLAEGGEIQGSCSKDSVSVLWNSVGKKKLMLVLNQKKFRKIQEDTLKLNIKELNIESEIIGPAETVSDTRSVYKLKLLNGIKPDYIHWSLSDDKAGCIIGNQDSLSCEVQWYSMPWNKEVSLKCRIGKCVYDFSRFKTIRIFQTTTVDKVRQEVLKDSISGIYHYGFTAITKGNKASEYIWDFGEGDPVSTKTNSVSYRFMKKQDSIIHIYVRVKDAVNKQISPVYVYGFHKDERVTLQEKPKVPKIISHVSCSETNNSYNIKLSTLFSGDIVWTINGEYYGKEHTIRLWKRKAGTKYRIELRSVKENKKDTLTVVLPSQLPVAQFEIQDAHINEKYGVPFICEEHSIKLLNRSTPDSLLYKWDFDDNTGSLSKNTFKAYMNDQSSFYIHNILLKVWDKYGCYSDTMKTINIKDNTIETLMTTIFTPNTAYVSSDSAFSPVNISVNFYGGTAPFHYRWFCRGQYLEKENDKILKRVKSRNTYYQAEVIDRFGCKYRFHLPPARVILKIED